VGVPDPSLGELIAAFVVRSSACAEEDLVRFAGERTARYKVPRWIFFAERADLPQTGSGKILKTRLREIAIEKTRR
jgi:acyl-CoA synthetase (AMP-forming)/AMP-acid ligase II